MSLHLSSMSLHFISMSLQLIIPSCLSFSILCRKSLVSICRSMSFFNKATSFVFLSSSFACSSCTSFYYTWAPRWNRFIGRTTNVPPVEAKARVRKWVCCLHSGNPVRFRARLGPTWPIAPCIDYYKYSLDLAMDNIVFFEHDPLHKPIPIQDPQMIPASVRRSRTTSLLWP